MIATIWQKQRTQCMLYKWLWSYENSKNLIWVAISAFQKTALEMLRAQLESMVSFTFFCSCVHYTTNNALLSCHENCCCYFCNQIVWEFSHNSSAITVWLFYWNFHGNFPMHLSTDEIFESITTLLGLLHEVKISQQIFDDTRIIGFAKNV